MILICGLILATSCCESCNSYKQATITFEDGTTKTYKIRACSSIDRGQIILYTHDGNEIYISNCKEIIVKRIQTNKTSY